MIVKETLHRTLTLLLPAIFPSWRFFPSIAPSPRIELRLEGEDVGRPFRPRPASIAAKTLLFRLFWNPDWNEQLFLVSLSERLIEAPSPQTIREIHQRVAADLAPGERFQIRLILIWREGSELLREVVYCGDVTTTGPP